MDYYVAVDCGKYNTKIAAYGPDMDCIHVFKHRTKISDGNFDDDLLEEHTYIVRIDGGKVYKIGSGAKTEAALETSKQTEIHYVNTMAAIAIGLRKSVDKVHVACGIPLQLGMDANTRLEYKDFMLKEGKHTVEIKCHKNGPVNKIEFTIGRRVVYPESIGVLFDHPVELQGITGIIDIGNLNTNNTYCADFQPQTTSCFTDEMGGKVLVSGLAQELSSELGARVDDNLVAMTLLKDKVEDRHLVSKNGNKELEEKSRQIIDRFLLEHVEEIKRKLDAKHWPVSFMNLCMVGGTVKLLRPEIKKVFGDVYIPNNPEMTNVVGFLKMICSDDDVNITNLQTSQEKKAADNEKTKQEKKAKSA